jgi:hypothetical protein
MRLIKIGKNLLGQPRVRRRRPASAFRPRLEVLEQREVPSAVPFTVTTTSGDPTVPGSLPYEITQVNNDNTDTASSPDVIKFKITTPPQGANGTQLIQLTSNLPALTNPVTIDGTTQGSPSRQPPIVLDGTGIGGNGLEVMADSTTIKGLDLINWDAGIQVDAVKNTVIQGNWIGLDPSGNTAGANMNGVAVNPGATGTTIGGTVAGARNIISGNNNGINSSANIMVQGNWLGTGSDGASAVANSGYALLVQTGSDGTVIGGTAPGAGNVISGNTTGIEFDGASNVSVVGNTFGLTADGSAPLANTKDALFAVGATGITVGGTQPGDGNVIAFSTKDGVNVDPQSQQVAVEQNSIYANGNLGIELQPGANNNQAAPVLTSASQPSDGNLTVSGTLNAPAANLTYRLEFFANPPGTSQGKTYLGAQTLTTTAAGANPFTYQLKVPSDLGDTNVTATATDANGNGNTSEFSKPVLAPAAPPSSSGGSSSGGSSQHATFDPGRVALDAFFVADGFATGNFLLAFLGLADYQSLLQPLSGPTAGQAQQLFGQDFFVDFLLLGGSA